MTGSIHMLRFQWQNLRKFPIKLIIWREFCIWKTVEMKIEKLTVIIEFCEF